MFTNYIEQLRKERGFTQVELAAMAGTSQANIQRYEQGRAEMRASTAFNIAKALNVKVEDLFDMDEIRASMPKNVILTDDERHLLDNYRSANAQGRRAIDAVADAMGGTR